MPVCHPVYDLQPESIKFKYLLQVWKSKEASKTVRKVKEQVAYSQIAFGLLPCSIWSYAVAGRTPVEQPEQLLFWMLDAESMRNKHYHRPPSMGVGNGAPSHSPIDVATLFEWLLGNN